MNYEFSEYTYPSSDGSHTVYAEIYVPKGRSPVGIVQLSHGMIDHVGRYRALADYLTGRGFVFAGNHHLGHGRTASKKEDYGYFARSNGEEHVLCDLYGMNRALREKFPNIPLVLFGHSMGSFIARLFIERYPDAMDAAVIHGTAGKNPLLPFGRALARVIGAVCSPRHRSRLVHNLAFGAYNSAFPKSEGERAWLSRDTALASETDEYIDFIFTVSGYSDLFRMLARCNRKKWYEAYPKSLRTLIVSGTCDPVGGKSAKGPREVYAGLLARGAAVDIKLYEGARHELFRETNKEEVFSDIAEWIESACNINQPNQP